MDAIISKRPTPRRFGLVVSGGRCTGGSPCRRRYSFTSADASACPSPSMSASGSRPAGGAGTSDRRIRPPLLRCPPRPSRAAGIGSRSASRHANEQRQLARRPFCALSGRSAECVDHRQSHRDDENLAFDMERPGFGPAPTHVIPSVGASASHVDAGELTAPPRSAVKNRFMTSTRG